MTTKSQSGAGAPGSPDEGPEVHVEVELEAQPQQQAPLEQARRAPRSSPPAGRRPRGGWRRRPGAPRGWRRAGPRRCGGSGRRRARSRWCRGVTPAAATTFRASASTSGPMPSPPMTATRWVVVVLMGALSSGRYSVTSGPPGLFGPSGRVPAPAGPVDLRRGRKIKNRPRCGRSVEAHTGGCAPIR